jgi:hypothetical protein
VWLCRQFLYPVNHGEVQDLGLLSEVQIGNRPATGGGFSGKRGRTLETALVLKKAHGALNLLAGELIDCGDVADGFGRLAGSVLGGIAVNPTGGDAPGKSSAEQAGNENDGQGGNDQAHAQ